MSNHLSRTAPSPARQRAGVRGVTLIELVVVVAIAAVLVTVVVPGMLGFFSARRVEDVARRLGDSLAQARIEAVKRNVPILVCADAGITNGSCSATPAAADWAKGWRLCYDVNADGVCDAGSAEDPNPIRLQGAVNSNVRLIGPASRIRFNPNGSLTATSFADFEATPGPGATPRWLIRFAASGALSVRKG